MKKNKLLGENFNKKHCKEEIKNESLNEGLSLDEVVKDAYDWFVQVLQNKGEDRLPTDGEIADFITNHEEDFEGFEQPDVSDPYKFNDFCKKVADSLRKLNLKFDLEESLDMDAKTYWKDPVGNKKKLEISNLQDMVDKRIAKYGKPTKELLDELKDFGYTLDKNNKVISMENESLKEDAKDTDVEAEVEEPKEESKEPKLETFDEQMDFLAKDEQEAIDGYEKVLALVEDEHVKEQLKHILDEEKAHKKFLEDVKKDKTLVYSHDDKEDENKDEPKEIKKTNVEVIDDVDFDIDDDFGFGESLKEDTIKQGKHWVNKGKEGTHGEFKTKKAADAQRKAMFANGYHEEVEEDFDDDFGGGKFICDDDGCDDLGVKIDWSNLDEDDDFSRQEKAIEKGKKIINKNPKLLKRTVCKGKDGKYHPCNESLNEGSGKHKFKYSIIDTNRDKLLDKSDEFSLLRDAVESLKKDFDLAITEWRVNPNGVKIKFYQDDKLVSETKNFDEFISFYNSYDPDSINLDEDKHNTGHIKSRKPIELKARIEK